MRPGLGTVKLWPDSVAALGVDPSTVPALHADVAKRLLAVPSPGSGEACPLRAIYVLNGGDEPGCTEVSGQEAFVELVRHSYAARFLGPNMAQADHFKRCAALAEAVSVRRLARLDGLARLDRFVERIEAEQATDHAGSGRLA